MLFFVVFCSLSDLVVACVADFKGKGLVDLFGGSHVGALAHHHALRTRLRPILKVEELVTLCKKKGKKKRLKKKKKKRFVFVFLFLPGGQTIFLSSF